jgi:hypothetical protein
VHLIRTRALGLLAALAPLVATVLALCVFAQTASAKPNCDVPHPPPICNRGELPDPPDPAPTVSPNLAVDVVRQTTDRNAIRVAGWTADGDAPTTPLTVRISVDGALAQTLTANASRPDVAAAYPAFGAAHGYDVTIPASSSAKTVCVTAVNVGSGSDTAYCQQVDEIVRFDANSISYDVAHATIAATGLHELKRAVINNDTSVQQSSTFAGSEVETDTAGWSDTLGLTVSVSGTVGTPGVASGSVSVGGSVAFTQNGSSSVTRTFSWSQPVIVPVRSRVIATVAVTRSTLVVPYTLNGAYVYRSGIRTPGSVSGTYAGVNSHDLEVTLKQEDLDGTPAARPAEQPAPNFLRVK